MKNEFLEITAYDEDCLVCLGVGFRGLLNNKPTACHACRGEGSEMIINFKLDKPKHLDYFFRLLEHKGLLEIKEEAVVVTLENLEEAFNQYLTEVFQ